MQPEEYIQQATEVKNIVSALARELAEIQVPEFSSEPITVEDAASLTGLTETAVRAGILNGWLPIGVAVCGGKIVKGPQKQRVSFVIYPRKVWEVTGHVWKGRDKL